MASQLLMMFGIVAITGSMVSARFFMLGDLEEPQRETDVLLVNTTLLTEFTNLGHDVELLASTRSSVRGQIKYVLGARVNGDSLVSHGAQMQKWPSPSNVAITLTYPATGLGAQVTYINVDVDQSTNLGRAYVVAGGLHQRMISIVIEAYNVVYVSYSIQFYGVA